MIKEARILSPYVLTTEELMQAREAIAKHGLDKAKLKQDMASITAIDQTSNVIIGNIDTKRGFYAWSAKYEELVSC